MLTQLTAINKGDEFGLDLLVGSLSKYWESGKDVHCRRIKQILTSLPGTSLPHCGVINRACGARSGEV